MGNNDYYWHLWTDSTAASTCSITYGDVWPYWVGATTTTATNIDVWTTWTTTNVTSISVYIRKEAARNQAFLQWIDTPAIARTVGQYVDHDQWNQPIGSNRTPDVFPPRVWTAEDRERQAQYLREQEAQRVERARVCEEQQKVAKAAEKRAEDLLIGCLTVEQREQYRRDRAFVVHGRSGRRYRIRYGTHGNVDVVDRNGRGMHRLCVQPSGVPVPDSMLTQKLWLENDEDGLLRVANQQYWPGEARLEDRPAILAAM